MEPMLTVIEVAEILRLHKKTVYRLVSEGRLKCYRPGGGRNILFSEEQVQDYLESKRKS